MDNTADREKTVGMVRNMTDADKAAIAGEIPTKYLLAELCRRLEDMESTLTGVKAAIGG